MLVFVSIFFFAPFPKAFYKMLNCFQSHVLLQDVNWKFSGGRVGWASKKRKTAVFQSHWSWLRLQGDKHSSKNYKLLCLRKNCNFNSIVCWHSFMVCMKCTLSLYHISWVVIIIMKLPATMWQIPIPAYIVMLRTVSEFLCRWMVHKFMTWIALDCFLCFSVAGDAFSSP